MLQTEDSQVLFGFSEEIDWIPLRFLKALPENHVCSACRFVPKRNCFLPCRCVLCEPCYEQCKARGGICALDGAVCPEAQVHWREVSVEKVMKREVRCWNKENGCDVVGDVSTMVKHFHATCAHHLTHCPKCAASVLRRDMIPHLHSRCSELAVSRDLRAPENAIRRSELEVLKTTLQDVKNALENDSTQRDALREKVAELAAVHQDSRCGASSEETGLKDIREGLIRAEAMMAQNEKLYEKQVAEVAAFGRIANEGIEAIMSASEKLLRCIQEQVQRESTLEECLLQRMNEIENEFQTLKEHIRGAKK